MPLPTPVPHPQPIPWRGAVLRTRWLLGTFAILGLAGGAAVAIPALTRPVCVIGPEQVAISSLVTIQSAEERFREDCLVDADADGRGESGGLMELAGGVEVRGSNGALHPPALGGPFRKLDAQGCALRSRYLFRMYLVGADGAPAGERCGSGFANVDLDTDAAESRWICYAWPERRDDEWARRTFVIDASGAIAATDCATYEGATGPAPDAALGIGGLRAGAAFVTDGTSAADGNVWRALR